MAREQRHAQVVFERADLTADGGLRQRQLLAGVREAARARDGVKDAKLVQIHVQPQLRETARLFGRFANVS